jgi:hypothetical protein
MARTPRDMTLTDPRARERDYWRTLVRNEIMASSASAGLRPSAVDLLAYRIAKAVEGDLNSMTA